MKKNIFFDVALCSVVPAVIVLFAYTTKSFWGDEILSIQFASKPVGELFSTLAGDYHPPLYFLLLKFWMMLFGDGEIGLRIFQGMLGSLFLFSTLFLFRKFFPEKQYHPFWLLLALSSEFWLFMPMLRYYTLAAAFVVLSTLFFFNWLEGSNSRNSVLLFLSYVVILYTDYPSSVIILFHLLFVVWMRKEMLKKSFLITVVAGVCFLPWLWITLAQIQSLILSHRAADFNTTPLSLILKAGYSFYAFIVGEMIYPFEVIGVSALLALAGCFVVAFKKKILFKQKFNVYSVSFVLLGILFTSLITTFISTHTSFIYTPSRTFFALPFVFVILGRMYEQFENRFLKMTLLAALVVINTYGNINWIMNRHFLMPVYATPWKQVIHDVEGQSGWMIADESLCYEYYVNHMDGLFPQSKTFSNLTETENAIQDNPPLNIFMLQTGRESTESGIPINVERYIQEHYFQQSVAKYLIIDDSYRIIKSRVLNRDSYDAKVTVYHYTTR